MKVKVFEGTYETELTNKLNDFINDIEKDGMEVVDIKFATFNSFFSALVMYRPIIKFDCDVQLWNEIPETLKASCIAKEGK